MSKEPELDTEFGGVVKELRKRHDRTQVALAEELGVDRRYILMIEKGRVPSPDLTIKIVDHLHVAEPEAIRLVVRSLEAQSQSGAAIRWLRQKGVLIVE